MKEYKFDVLDEKFRPFVEKVIKHKGNSIGMRCRECPLDCGRMIWKRFNASKSLFEIRVEMAQDYIRQLDNAKIDADFEKHGMVFDDKYGRLAEALIESGGEINWRLFSFAKDEERVKYAHRYIERLDKIRENKTKAQVIVGSSAAQMEEVNAMLYNGGFVWRGYRVAPNSRDTNSFDFIRIIREGTMTSVGPSDEPYDIIRHMAGMSRSVLSDYKFFTAEEFLATPTLIKGWKEPKVDTYEINIKKNGKPIHTNILPVDELLGTTLKILDHKIEDLEYGLMWKAEPDDIDQENDRIELSGLKAKRDALEKCLKLEV